MLRGISLFHQLQTPSLRYSCNSALFVLLINLALYPVPSMWQMGVGITISCPDPYELAGGTWKEPIGFTDAWSNVADPWEWLVSGCVERSKSWRRSFHNTGFSISFASCFLAVLYSCSRVYIHDGTFWKPPTNGDINFDLNRAGSMTTPDELNFLDNGLAQVWGCKHQR